MAFGNPSEDRKAFDAYRDKLERDRKAGQPPKRYCQLCRDTTAATARVPGGTVEWVCITHAEEFWRGLVQTAAGLATRDRAITAAIEADFDEQQEAAGRALRAADAHAYTFDLTDVVGTQPA